MILSEGTFLSRVLKGPNAATLGGSGIPSILTRCDIQERPVILSQFAKLLPNVTDSGSCL